MFKKATGQYDQSIKLKDIRWVQVWEINLFERVFIKYIEFKNIYCIFVIVILNIASTFLNVSNTYNPKYIKLLSNFKGKKKQKKG